MASVILRRGEDEIIVIFMVVSGVIIAPAYTGGEAERKVRVPICLHAARFIA